MYGKENKMSKKLMKKENVEKILEKELGPKNERFFVISTENHDLTTNPKGRNAKKSRSEWADKVVKKLYGIERSQIVKSKSRVRSSGEFNFSYIKFAENEEGIFAIVHGKSSFHCMYPSDVWFYDFGVNEKRELKEIFELYNLEWYKKEIIIIKNQDALDGKEAYIREQDLKSWFGTLD